MIFLIAYDRRSQKLVQEVEQFDSSQSAEARRRRLDLQLSLPVEDGRYEVALLEADSMAIVRETHARYFAGDIGELVEDARGELKRYDADLRERRRVLKRPSA
jgi:hypothetical protein